MTSISSADPVAAHPPPGDPAEPGTPDAATLRPLTAGQHGIALQQQVAAHSAIFNVPAALELHGPLDRQALVASLTEVIRRHDVLRTRLTYHHGELAQVIDPPGAADMVVHDLRHVPSDERVPAARTLLDADAARPFDLFTEYGLRLNLVILDAQRHVFAWTMHHLFCDGWSKSVFARDLSLLYAGRAAELPELRVTYGDHVVEQRRLDQRIVERQLGFWQGHLAGVHLLPGVPRDHPRTGTLQPRGADVAVAVDADTRDRLTRVARDQRVTVFMVLHAALAALIARVVRHPDVVVNVPYGSRPSPAYEPLIGFFVNVLALRCAVPDDLRFADLLREVRGVALDGFDHHHVPFQQVAAGIAEQHGGQVGPLHQTSLAFANLPYRDITLAGLTAQRFPLTRVDIRYELEWHLWENDADGTLGGRLIYRPDLFDEATARTFVAAYQQLLTAAAAHPERTVGELTAALQLSERHLGGPAELIEVRPSESARGTGPATPTEAAVLTIWSGLLHRDDIGPADDFFAAGGHSLLVAFMVGRIREQFGVSLPIRQIVQNPTITAIAAAIDGAARSAPSRVEQ